MCCSFGSTSAFSICTRTSMHISPRSSRLFAVNSYKGWQAKLGGGGVNLAFSDELQAGKLKPSRIALDKSHKTKPFRFLFRFNQKPPSCYLFGPLKLSTCWQIVSHFKFKLRKSQIVTNFQLLPILICRWFFYIRIHWSPSNELKLRSASTGFLSGFKIRIEEKWRWRPLNGILFFWNSSVIRRESTRVSEERVW